MRDFEVGDLVTQRRLDSWQKPIYLRVTEIIGFGGRFRGKPDGDERSELGRSYTTAEWELVQQKQTQEGEMPAIKTVCEILWDSSLPYSTCREFNEHRRRMGSDSRQWCNGCKTQIIKLPVTYDQKHNLRDGDGVAFALVYWLGLDGFNPKGDYIAWCINKQGLNNKDRSREGNAINDIGEN